MRLTEPFPHSGEVTIVPERGDDMVKLSYVGIQTETHTQGVEMRTYRSAILTTAVMALALVAAACGSSEPAATTPKSSTTSTTVMESRSGVENAPTSDDDLTALLARLIADTELPALGVTVFDGETIIETAVAGVRRQGDQTAVEIGDQFSIGSNTKAMTAALAAIYVDEGLIGWDTTIKDVYDGVLPALDDSLAGVTIRQLLNHTGGINDDLAYAPLLAEADFDSPVVEQRLSAAEITLTRPGHHPVGQYMYSNVGYTLVGAMFEQLTGTSWEDQIQTRLFDQLGMASCGFYAPGTPGEVDQPWGHFTELGGQPMDPGDADAEYPHVLAPAGMVHCNMSDWAVFLQSQLRGFEGSASEIISPEGFVALQTPAAGSDYALGWATLTGPEGVALTHDGSNDRFTSNALLAPGKDWGVLVVTNLGEVAAAPTIAAVTDAMMARHLATEPEAGTADPTRVASTPPLSFSEVQTEYTAAYNVILAAGRQVASEFLDGNTEEIHSQMASTTATAVTAKALREAYDELRAQGPLTGPTADRAVQLSPQIRLYQAELDWGDRAMALAVTFNETAEITGISLSPQPVLPPDPAADHESTIDYRLPFDGLWFVLWGGDTAMQNYHVVAQDQRHAFDIAVWKNGGTHRNDGTANADYWAYGQPILAPAKGTVVTVVDGLVDQIPNIGSDAVNPAGNHVVIEVANGEYALIAHMQPGSITVAEGDVVQSGQRIGLVGNSGNTSEPHIHIHLQNRPVFDPQATGLLLEFTDYSTNGEDTATGQPLGGQFVANG